MAQSKRSSYGAPKSRSSSMGKVRPTPQIHLIELKQRILAALNKLADRDTQHIAVEDLEHIATTIFPERISLFLSCLYEIDDQQKSAVRRECVKLFGTVASLHDDHLAPHLPKIVINIAKRLRDPDSSVRDACVDAMGTLAAKVISPSCAGSATGRADNVPSITFPGPLGVFAKPLLDALSEQSRGVQVGAAMCLARVIDNSRDPPLAALQRICSRVIKFLNSPGFSAKAALLSVITSVVQAGGATSYPCLAALMACIEDCLKSNDWATRKAAAETLDCMASRIAPSLGGFKLSALRALESCRFDKVKPVRDTVLQTLEEWRRIPNSKFISDLNSTEKDSACVDDQHYQIQTKKADGLEEASTMLERACQEYSSNQPLNFGLCHARSGANNIRGNSQKKPRSQLTDKKANPNFFQNLDKIDFDDWRFDIVMPHSLTATEHELLDALKSEGASPCNERKTFQEGNPSELSFLHVDADAADGQDRLESVRSLSGALSDSMQKLRIVNENQVSDEDFGMSSMKNGQSTSKSVKPTVWFHQQVQNDEGFLPGLVSSSCSSTTGGQPASSGIDAASTRRHLHQIVSQQANLLDLLQKFISSSQETFLGLEDRVTRVETVVYKLVVDLTNGRSDVDNVSCHGKFLADANLDRANGKHDSDNVHCCCNIFGGADILSSKFWKKSENRGCVQGRSVSSDSTSHAGIGCRNVLFQNTESGIVQYDRFRLGSTACIPLTGDKGMETQANSSRVHVDASSDSVRTRKRSEAEDSLHLNEKNREQVSRLSRLGEGPYPRSTWLASKDKTTLAAIRVAGEDARLKIPESLKDSVGSKWSSLELRPEDSSQRIGGQGQGSFWSFWTRVAEFLHSGDVNSAYVEVLCSGDELLLVRLMSRTGPVLEQLSSGTAHKLLQTIIQMLRQQTFLDVIIPWVQQVAEFVTSRGPACVGLSLDNERELIASLEDASTSDYSEVPIAKTLGDLATQLSSIWGLVRRKELQGCEN